MSLPAEFRAARGVPSALGSPDLLGSSASVETLFLDYDGTLSPIVAHPDDARIPESTRTLLRTLADRMNVAIVSGRSVEDIRGKVGVEGLTVAGSHGQEIEFSGGCRYEHPASQQWRHRLDAAEQLLRELVVPLRGVLVERKPFSIAVHTRNVASQDARAEAQAIASKVAEQEGLEVRLGKEVRELKPDVSWDKGHAIAHILSEFEWRGETALFIGDDATDEDGFVALNRLGGTSILVGPADERMTHASYRLADVEEVIRFLGGL